VRFFYKEKDKINAKILKDIKFPIEFDAFELCTPELQEKLVPVRNKFKVKPMLFIFKVCLAMVKTRFFEVQMLQQLFFLMVIQNNCNLNFIYCDYYIQNIYLLLL